MPTEIDKLVAGILQRSFDLPSNSTEQPPEKWRLALIDRIDYLITYDYEKLLQLLYRIDVDENKAKKSLIEAADKKPSEVVADLIIERLIEKAKSRINNPVPPHTGDLQE